MDEQWDALDYIEGRCIGHDEEWTGEELDDDREQD